MTPAERSSAAISIRRPQGFAPRAAFSSYKEKTMTVAMESTGVYWIPLFQILEERGLKVYIVNAHYLKSVPGRKSNVSDCQWIQNLHLVGLLRASFRPPDAICAIRTLWRHHGSLLEMAAEHILAV
jgi:transposase